jgi:ABC-type nitrate/sulfonate/bicarbonate transport system substrate-binding protein
VLKAPGTRLVAKSPPAEGTLNRSFALFVREDSGVYTPSDLAGRAVAIEEGTGAQYTAMVDLEAHVPLEKIRLVQVGEPHRRLKALIGGEVESASLVGPWSDIGKALGLRMVLKTKRLNPTTIVVREDAETGLLRRFFKAVNNAIDLMNEHPARFQESYFQRVKSIVDEMSLGAPLEALRRAVVVPRWSKWEAYTEHDFERAYAWMVDRNLAPPGHVPGEVVGTNNQDLFS